MDSGAREQEIERLRHPPAVWLHLRRLFAAATDFLHPSSGLVAEQTHPPSARLHLHISLREKKQEVESGTTRMHIF